MCLNDGAKYGMIQVNITNEVQVLPYLSRHDVGFERKQQEGTKNEQEG